MEYLVTMTTGDAFGPRTVFGMNASPNGAGPWDPAGYYELKLDTNEDLVEDITWRFTLIGPRARSRLDRLLVIAGHPSILEAAQALGLWQATLYEQVAPLEHACGGALVNRSRRAAGTVILTPLGQQLCQQARDYLACQPGPSVTSGAPTPGSTQRGDGTHQIEAIRLQRAGEHVTSDVTDVTSPGMGLAALDARLIPVDAHHLRDAPAPKRPGETAVAAPHIDSALAASRNDVEDQSFIPGTHPAKLLQPPPSAGIAADTALDTCASNRQRRNRQLPRTARSAAKSFSRQKTGGPELSGQRIQWNPHRKGWDQVPEKRKHYSPEFKEEAARLVVEFSRPIAHVAREIGDHEITLRYWVKAYREKHAAGEQPLDTAERVRLRARNLGLPPGAVFHSDRGSNYTSAELAAVLDGFGIRQSVGRMSICSTMRWPSRLTLR